MIQIIKMAFRDLGRNRRRSFFSSLALAIGLAVLLLMAAFVEGELRDALDSTIRLQSGHFQIMAKSYDDVKTSLAFEDLIENPEAIVQQVSTLDPVKVATPRLFASGIVSSGDISMGVRLVGIDPASEANAPFRDGMVQGQFLQAEDREGIVIGKTLADKMELKAGDSLNVLVNTSNGDVDQQSFTIRGIYNTKTPSFDQVMVFLPMAKAQIFSRAANHASIIFVLLKDQSYTPAVVKALQTNRYKVVSYMEANEFLVQFEDMSNTYMGFLYLIVLAITAAVIVNTLIMAVFERTREIGILSAIGMKSTSIMAMFFVESGLLAIGGIVMGLILGCFVIYFTSRYGFYIGDMGLTGIMLGERIYTYLTLEDTINLSLMALVVTLLASLYPALIAARMEPVAAMRGGK